MKPSRKPLFNISVRRVGGLNFIMLGRITLMWCVSKPRPEPKPKFRATIDGALVLGWADEK